MQNNVFPTVFYMWNCANGCNTTLGHDMFFDIYKLSSRIGYGGSPCGRPMSAPTNCFVFAHKTNGGHWPPLQMIHNFHINKNGRETMFCILQPCYPTTIFHFQFSILHLIKPFARYFKQRFAPFIRHRRRSQGYPYCCNSTSAIALPNRLPE